jgi:hypothetical protein
VAVTRTSVKVTGGSGFGGSIRGIGEISTAPGAIMRQVQRAPVSVLVSACSSVRAPERRVAE